MIRVIEQSESAYIQKITTPKGEVRRYQVVPRNRLGDSQAVTVVSTLKGARDILAALLKTTQGE